MSTSSRAKLRLVGSAQSARAPGWAWFCGHCAAPGRAGGPPAPHARVCPACGLGLLLEARRDAVPSRRQAFLVIDSYSRVQALSVAAERLLHVREQAAVDRPLCEFVVLADTERPQQSLEQIIAATIDDTDQLYLTQVRPPNTFGVRMSARVGACGPPRAALLVLGGLHRAS